MHARIPILGALAAGPVLGMLAGLAVDPAMLPAPEPAWRHSAKAVFVPSEAYHSAEAPPQDLNPHIPPPGYRAILARRAAAEQRYAAPPVVAPDEMQPAALAADEAGLAATSDAATLETVPAATVVEPAPEPAEPAVVL